MLCHSRFDCTVRKPAYCHQSHIEFVKWRMESYSTKWWIHFANKRRPWYKSRNVLFHNRMLHAFKYYYVCYINTNNWNVTSPMIIYVLIPAEIRVLVECTWMCIVNRILHVTKSVRVNASTPCNQYVLTPWNQYVLTHQLHEISTC